MVLSADGDGGRWYCISGGRADSYLSSDITVGERTSVVRSAVPFVNVNKELFTPSSINTTN